MEEYEIKRGREEIWKKCKCLESLLDVENIKRRKVLGTDAYNQLRHISEGKKPSLDIKSEFSKAILRAFSCTAVNSEHQQKIRRYN